MTSKGKGKGKGKGNGKGKGRGKGRGKGNGKGNGKGKMRGFFAALRMTSGRSEWQAVRVAQNGKRPCCCTKLRRDAAIESARASNETSTRSRSGRIDPA